MLYALGILTGLAIATLILALVVYFRPAIERTIQQTASKVKRKGSILEAENEDVEDWIDKLKSE